MLQTKRAFRGLSGTYNIANERGTQRNIECLVEFPNNTQQTFQLDRRSKGQALLEGVFKHLNLVQNDFFSLKIPQESQRQLSSSPQSQQQTPQHANANLTSSNFNSSNKFKPQKNSLASPNQSNINHNNNRTTVLNNSCTRQEQDGNSSSNNQSQPSNVNSPSLPTTLEQSISTSASHHNNNDKNVNCGKIAFDHLSVSEQPLLACVNNQRANPTCWLDPNKGIVKQYKCGPPYRFYFSVRFYVSDTRKLTDVTTINLMYSQLRNDLLDCRLLLFPNLAALLTSLILQSEVGDYTRELNDDNYVSKFQLLPNQNDEMNKKIIDLHKQHKSMSSTDARYRFLENASKKLDCYGVEFYDAKDFNKIFIQIGVSSDGIVVFKHGKKISSYSWANIIKIMFKRKIFSIQLRKEDGDNCDNLIEYNLLTNLACKSFWQECVAQHSFFRLQQPKSTPKKFFSSFFNFGSKFQYNGKTEYQTIDESRKRSVSHFSRTPSKRYARRTIPVGWPPWNSNELTAGHQNGQSCSSLGDKNSNSDQNFNQTGVTSNSHSGSYRPKSHMLKSFMFIDEFKNMDAVDNLTNASKFIDNNKKQTGVEDQSQRKSLGRSESARISNSIRNTLFSSKKLRSPSSNQFVRFSESLRDKFLVGKSKSQKISKPKYENINEIPTDLDDDLDSERDFSKKIVKLSPGKSGKYGFKIRGYPGHKNSESCARQNIIVDKVSPGSPAATCDHRLYEGDRILAVNNQSTEGMSAEQIETMIKNIQHQHLPALILEVLSKVTPRCSSNSSQEISNETTDKRLIQSTSFEKNSSLHDLLSSIQQIKESLESKKLIEEFEQLSRKNDDEPLEESRSIENIDKNRYRDILPYDSTRVSLLDSMTGDYINASYVNMKVPSGRINRYIATQGPLATTCEDFWQMVWEQNSSLIIMVTPLVEAGRVKCHKYWPDEKEHCRHGQIVVRNLKEKSRTATIERSLQISDIKSSEKRITTQIQYRAWPDHEVPEDCSDFLKLVNRVRKHRLVKPNDPIVVHCSAGIGRTGVLILMETAICIMEFGEPVYPIKILDDMRKQRAMLIQTSSQFQFVADAVCKVYDQRLYKSSKKFSKKIKSK